MNFFIGTSLIMTVITLISIIIEPRRFRNGILVLFSLGCYFLTLVYYLSSLSNYKINNIFAITFILMIFLGYLAIMIYLLINGIKVIKKEGLSISHSLSLLLSIIMLILPESFVGLIIYANGSIERFDVLCCVMTLFIYFMITFGGFFLYSLLYCLMPRRMNCNYIIIHGAGLKKDGTVTPLLRQRIDKAIKVYKKCRNNPKFVPSGGQGGDEVISEAAAIRNYLLDKGIKDEDIVMEDKSTTTYENLKNVKEMLDEREKGRKYSCIFVTNNYHVLRTSFYAKKLKMRAQGVGAKTAGYFLPSAFIREYVAVMKMNKISLILLVCLLILEIKVI